MKTVWTTVFGFYLLSLLPVGFLAASAFAQRNVDPSGDARNAAIMFGVYLVGIALLLLLTKPRRPLQREEAAE